MEGGRRILFIVPAVMLTGIFAWLYKDYGQLPQIQPFIRYKTSHHRCHYFGTIFPLAKILKTVQLGIIGVLFCCFRCCSSMILLLASSWLYFEFIDQQNSTTKGTVGFRFFPVSKTALLAPTNFNLFLIFLKIGAILYGSGYVLFCFFLPN
jgi:chromate transporter